MPKYSVSYLSVAAELVFVRSELFKAHRSACMEFLRADTDLCAEAEHESVGETSGNIGVNAGGVNFVEKLFGVLLRRSDDRVRVSGVVAVGMRYGFVY